MTDGFDTSKIVVGHGSYRAEAMAYRLPMVLITSTLLLAIACATSKARADDKPAAAATQVSAPINTLSDAEKAAGWKLLFDGKNTEGWRGYRQDKCPPGWQVVDGTLALVQPAGDLITTEKYESFELVWDWKLTKDGNSGVMYHVLEDGDATWFTGPEYQLYYGDGEARAILSGWCYALYKPPIDPMTGKPLNTTRPAGEWNTSRLLIDGPHVEHWMNGVKYLEYELWSDDWNQRVAKSKFGKLPNFGKAHSGYICLQNDTGQVAFRNIKIRVIQGSADQKR